MLDFANRPPQAPEDARLTKTGEHLLRTAARDWTTMTVLGRSIGAQIVDAFGPDASITRAQYLPVCHHVLDQTREILDSRQQSALVGGIDNIMHEFVALERAEEGVVT